MRDLLDILIRANVATAAAVLAVLLLRVPARRWFGPHLAYCLWALAPLAVVAAVIPPRVVVAPAPASPDIAAFALRSAPIGPAPLVHAAALSDLSPLFAGLWAVGAATLLVALWRSQVLFNRAIREGRAGPAVIGVLAPRIVTPDDFAATYTAEEQHLVLAHEATHVARQDSRINALVALARCIAWFNPTVHLMARLIRVDQEFACDAAVLARHPRARRVYAEALLKAQIAARPLPFGCYWPVAASHPLVARVSLLSRPRGGVLTHAAGVTFTALVILGGALAVWTARPPRIVFALSHEAAILERAVRFAPHSTAPIATAPAASHLSTPSGEAQLTRAAFVEPPALTDLQPLQLRFDPRPTATAIPAPVERRERINGAANWSSVAPGTAIRVIATMVDPQGIELTTDLTAFGSQSLYRVGYVERGGSRLKLFTRVVQQGDRYRITAALNRTFQPDISGAIDLGSGESGTIHLPEGLDVDVFAESRPETGEEIAAARALHGRRFVNVEQFQRTF